MNLKKYFWRRPIYVISGLKTGLDFGSNVRKHGWKMTFLGLKLDRDLEKRAAHSNRDFLPPGGVTSKFS